MSHGPGKWQRIILEAVESGEKVELLKLLPPPEDYVKQYGELGSKHSSDEEALKRAARVLSHKGLIEKAPGRWHRTYRGGSHVLTYRKCCTPRNKT